MSRTRRNPGFALACAVAGLCVALWLIVWTVMEPGIVGPLFFVGLGLGCLFLASSAHYFHRWQGSKQNHDGHD